MKIEIDDEVRDRTTECEEAYACILNVNHTTCKADQTKSNGSFFIECKEAVCCNYRVSYGFSSYICTCPVRKEIYRKYKY